MTETQKLPVSVCMLVKNEEDRLINSLPPLSIFKEVLIYDSGSTDESINICKKYHARVIQGEWLGFSETRKKLFFQVSQPWIFWLDADEVVTAELSRELRAINFENPHCEGFDLNRKVFFENKWINYGEWFPDWNLRIFRSDSWKMEHRDVHEGIIIKGTSKRLNGLLEHHSYRDWNDRNSRVKRYAELWAQMKFSEGISPFAGEGSSRAIWRFFRNYIIRLGFLDGVLGFKISLSIAKEVNLKYKKLHQLHSQ